MGIKMTYEGFGYMDQRVILGPLEYAQVKDYLSIFVLCVPVLMVRLVIAEHNRGWHLAIFGFNFSA
jgi:hypothetical protein